MRKFLSFAVAFCCALASFQALADAAKAQAYLESIRSHFGYPGVSAAVGVNGKLAWAGAAGYSNLASQTPAKPTDVYRLGSVSKMLTTAAVARLVQEGKLDLDAPVQKYVPEFPEKDKGAITTRLLAGHLAGIPHYTAEDKPDTDMPDYDSVIAAIAEYRDKPQLHAPGTKFHYSTYGFSLISAVVERASGQPFPEYMQAAIFAPLGMTNTRLERAGEAVPDVTTFYQRTSGEIPAVVPPMHVSYKWAGGGMLSSAEDLVRFGAAWLPGSTMFTPETLTLVFTSQKTTDGTETGTGLGWRIGIKDGDKSLYDHGGMITGGRAYIIVDAERRVVAAMLGNMLGKGNFSASEVIALTNAFLE